MSDANSKQVGGSHYSSEYQHWDFVRDFGLDYMRAQVIKYISRARKKNGTQDLEKALHFLDKMEEQLPKRTLEDFCNANGLEFGERAAIGFLTPRVEKWHIEQARACVKAMLAHAC